MDEVQLDARPFESVALDIGPGAGALVLGAPGGLVEEEIEVSRVPSDGKRIHAVVHEYRVGDRPVFAAVYPDLPEGVYDVLALGSDDAVARVTIRAGEVTEFDWPLA